MRSTGLCTSRWRRRWSRDSSGGGAAGRELRLPDFPHDGAGQLVGIVVRGDADVDHIRGDETHLRVPCGVDRPEYHGSLTARRRVRSVRVHEHEVEEVGADVLADNAKVVVDSIALGLAGLRGEIAD